MHTMSTTILCQRQAAVCICSRPWSTWSQEDVGVIWLGTRSRLHQLTSLNLNLSIGSDTIKPSTIVHDFGVFIDDELTFCEHVRRVTSSCFFHLQHLHQICKHVNRQVMKQLVHAFVISRLVYCNGTLAGLPMRLLGQLQQVQNAAARLVLGLQPRDYIKPALFKLHWLPVHLREQYKLSLLMHSVIVQCCPSYISNTVQNTAASSWQHGQSVIYCSAYKDKAPRTCVLCHWPDSLELTTVWHSQNHRH